MALSVAFASKWPVSCTKSAGEPKSLQAKYSRSGVDDDETDIMLASGPRFS